MFKPMVYILTSNIYHEKIKRLFNLDVLIPFVVRIFLTILESSRSWDYQFIVIDFEKCSDWGFRKIEDIIIKTMISGENVINNATEMFVPFANNCFELLGFDILNFS